MTIYSGYRSGSERTARLYVQTKRITTPEKYYWNLWRNILPIYQIQPHPIHRWTHLTL